MNHDLARRSHALLMQAIEVEEARREAFVDAACASDPLLREHVAGLLAAMRQSGGFLESPALGNLSGAAGPPRLSQPSVIRNYRIVRTIGAGGMATVYEAIQDQPERRVALKVLRYGLARTSAVQRFQFETEVLARLQHPGIAQIFEAGAFDDGHGAPTPFFAMEFLADADTITSFATRRALTTRRRLALLADVCDAVQHGHQLGVIHRDLKPGNVLVDSSGRPKVIDFGVARSLDPQQARITQDSGMGELVGTLNYMSPEQCAGGNVDIRADVYALGVILYELVCGRLPHDLSRVPVPEALRIIREVPPPRPATLNPRLRGDVDAIIGKALEKDPQRRYPTAAALAADIRRHLECEPIQARPASPVYQLRKFAQRHWLPVSAAAAVVVSLAAGLVVASRMAYVATRAREDARTQQKRAETAGAAEALARHKAELEGDIAREVNEFWIDIIRRGSPLEARRPNLEVREALDRAAPRVASEISDPAVRKQLHRTIADAYHALGLAEQDLAHGAEAWRLEGEHPSDDLLESSRLRRTYARGLVGTSRFDEADALLVGGLDLCALHLPDNCDEALRLRVALAQVAEQRGELERAREFLWSVVEALNRRGDESAFALASQSMFARILAKLGRAAAAERILSAVLPQQRSLLGDDHGDTMETLNSLARARRMLGRFREAEADLRALAEIATAALGGEHNYTLVVRNNLGGVLREMRRFEESEAVHRDVYEIRLRTSGPDELATLTTAANLATLLSDLGRFDEAETLLRDVVERRTRQLGAEHVETLNAQQSLGRVLVETSQHAEAEQLYAVLLAQLRRTLPPQHINLAPALRNYALVLGESGCVAESLPLLIESHDILLAAYGAAHPQTLRGAEFVCSTLEQLGRAEELAEWRLRRDAYAAAQSE